MSAPPNTLWTFLMRQAGTGPLGDFLDGPYALPSMPVAMREYDERVRAAECADDLIRAAIKPSEPAISNYHTSSRTAPNANMSARKKMRANRNKRVRANAGT